jgi:hypothetical protein
MKPCHESNTGNLHRQRGLPLPSKIAQLNPYKFIIFANLAKKSRKKHAKQLKVSQRKDILSA